MSSAISASYSPQAFILEPPSAPHETTSPLQGRAAQFSLAPLNDPWTAVFAGIWALLLLDTLCKTISIGWSCIENGTLAHLQSVDITNLVLFGGTVANFLHWADSVGIMALGAGAALAHAVGFGSSAVISLFGVVEDLQELFYADAARNTRQHKISKLLDLGYRVTTLAWSLLGVASFVAGVAVLPAEAAWLFLSSFLFFMAGIMYRARLARQAGADIDALQPDLQPVRAT